MNDFVRCNKIAGVHWLKRPLDQQLSIIIKLKPPDNVISLPKFEDYTNESSNLSLDQNTEVFSFKWQEKSFSAYELQHYSEIHNCFTENEFRYHELLKNSEIVPKKVFTYIHDDYYLPVPQEKKKMDHLLSSYLERLNLDGAVGSLGEVFGGKSVSERHLFKSQEDVCDENEEWTAMHIVFDHSDINEETVILKREATLVSMYHNTKYNYIIISPDVNKLDTNPYNVETNTGELLGYQYEVDVHFGDDDDDDGEELVTLLTKLYNKWEKRHKQLVNFVMPPIGKMQYYITIDLTSAKGFEMDNLYVEFNIKLPEDIESIDTLHGRTHVSEAISLEGEDVCHFGHLLELSLEHDFSLDVKPLNIYLEIISIDVWHRQRTEGYTYFSLPLTPGSKTKVLRCVRPDENNGDERRFFVGGCHLIRDLDVLSNAELQPGKYAYTSTGTIQVRHATIAHSPQPSPAAGPVYYESSSSALLQGAEAALRKYKKARARLAFATTLV